MVRPLHFVRDFGKIKYGARAWLSNDSRFMFVHHLQEGGYWTVGALNYCIDASAISQAMKSSEIRLAHFNRLQDAIAALESLYVSA